MPKLIMVVNDTQEILMLFQEILEGEGYEVSLHSYSNRDLEEVKKVKPDLIISDHPPIADKEKQGWQFIQKLRMSRETELIPIILCTTSVKMAEEAEGHLTEKGVTVVLKPFNIDELLAAVEAMIGTADSPETGPLNPQLNSSKSKENAY